jgi:hypothetical protein
LFEVFKRPHTNEIGAPLNGGGIEVKDGFGIFVVPYPLSARGRSSK